LTIGAVTYNFAEDKADADVILCSLGETRDSFIKVLKDAKLDKQNEDALCVGRCSDR
jgi:hypothetical protein